MTEPRTRDDPSRDRRRLLVAAGASSMRGNIAHAFARWREPDFSPLPLLIVLCAYAGAAFLLPTLAPVSFSDDWTYARSVHYLVNDGEIHILSVAAATQVFQLFWGAGFAFVFGLSFGVLRVSTIVLVFASGIALFGLCRELGVGRGRSALGVAVYLFNPVLFPITYSFMSDPHFLSLLVISIFLYVRGLRDDRTGELATLCASAVAALACLQRPHGALIPFAVTVFLIGSGRIRWNRTGLVRFLLVVMLPAVTFLGYYLLFSRGIPSQQHLFINEMKSAGLEETWLLFRRLTVMEMVYAGLFVLPIVAAMANSVWRLFDLKARGPWLVFLVWEGVLTGGIVWLWGEHRRMPYIPHFLGRAGPGSGDLRNARPPIAEPAAFDRVTILAGASALLFGFIVIRAIGDRSLSGRSGAGLVLTIGAFQTAGVLPQSFLFRNWIVSLDRYLLPVLPVAVVLLLWSVNGVTLRDEIGWVVAVAFALFSIIGTRDILVFQSDVWSLATRLNEHGVANTRLDAGYAWDAYHLWEYGEDNNIERQTPDGPWWTDVYAKPTDSTYVIAGGPLPGYTILSVHPYSAWLQRKPVALYVLRRENATPDNVVWP